MKRYKNLVIGGIQNKIFNLILFTVVLLTASVIVVSIYHNKTLSRIAEQSNGRQKTAITETTTEAMSRMASQTLARSNRMEADAADRMFEDTQNRVAFLGDCATKLFAHPEDFGPKPCDEPDPADDGVWTVKVIYAEGVDANDPAVAEKTALIANMAEIMSALRPSMGTVDAYIALPEGVFMCADDNSSSWFEDGRIMRFDPRERNWYHRAAEAGRLVFTDGEWDANTDNYCIECAMPVYGPDGSLQAVVGADLYLDKMQAGMRDSALEGEYTLLVNQSGRAVLEPQAEVFPMSEADRAGDLRASSNAFLAQTVGEALRGNDIGVTQGELEGGTYFLTATPIKSTGWVLLSAFDQVVSNRSTAVLTDSFETIQSEAAADYRNKTGRSQTVAVVLLLLVMVMTLTFAALLGRRIVRPLNAITLRVSELSDSNLEFRMEDTFRTGDEVQELAEAFAALSHKTVAYMDRIVKVTAEKERIGTELALATQIQAAMLPHIFPAFPDRGEFDIFAVMDPAKEVGGDFYDYFLIDEDHLGMVIADVSGKGVPAALFMMASKIILQSVAMLGNSPAVILDRTNEAICSNNEAQMFVTVWLGILEISTGKLTAANAGHEYPVLKRPDGGYELFKDKHGFVIGGMDGARYREYELQLEPGTKLFVYTDGVPEATNADKELFGTERMINALNAGPMDAPRETLGNVRAAVDAFVKDAEQFDDLTMLCMEYKGVGQKGGESK